MKKIHSTGKQSTGKQSTAKQSTGKQSTGKQSTNIKGIIKLTFTWSYLISLLISAAAIFRYAHIQQLKPGFILFSFAMKFFVFSFLLSWICLFIIFFVMAKFQKKM